MGGPDGWFARVAHELARDCPPERFQAVMGIGPTVAASVGALVRRPGTAGVLDDLVDAGVEPVRPGASAGRGGEACRSRSPGRTLVVTGTLAGFDRQACGGGHPGRRRQGVGVGQPQDRLPGRG